MSMEARRAGMAAPAEIGRAFIDRANAADVDGLVALYERDAILVAASGEVARGAGAIRGVLQRMVEEMATRRMTFGGEPAAALINGDLALTSTRFTVTTRGDDGRETTVTGTTAEVARRQPAGDWLFVIDQPNIAK